MLHSGKFQLFYEHYYMLYIIHFIRSITTDDGTKITLLLPRDKPINPHVTSSNVTHPRYNMCTTNIYLTLLSKVLSRTKPNSWSLTKLRSFFPALMMVTMTS